MDESLLLSKKENGGAAAPPIIEARTTIRINAIGPNKQLVIFHFLLEKIGAGILMHRFEKVKWTEVFLETIGIDEKILISPN